jgi:uncharacterized protein
MCCRRRPRVAGAGGHYAGYCSPLTFDDTPADPIAHGVGKLRVGGLIVVAPFAACGGITLPDGTLIATDQREISQILSRALSRNVTFDAANRGRRERAAPSRADSSTAKAEEYWPDIEGLDHRDTVTDFTLPEGTFFDTAVVHVLTTATLDRLRELYPQGRFEARRFRPNMVVQTPEGERAFAEDAWIGKVVAIGETVRLKITGSCPRCVMTTLPQGDLPKDVGILRAAAQHNHANVGVYASVLQGGRVRHGDSVEPQ